MDPNFLSLEVELVPRNIASFDCESLLGAVVCDSDDDMISRRFTGKYTNIAQLDTENLIKKNKN